MTPTAAEMNDAVLECARHCFDPLSNVHPDFLILRYIGFLRRQGWRVTDWQEFLDGVCAVLSRITGEFKSMTIQVPAEMAAGNGTCSIRVEVDPHQLVAR